MSRQMEGLINLVDIFFCIKLTSTYRQTFKVTDTSIQIMVKKNKRKITSLHMPDCYNFHNFYNNDNNVGFSVNGNLFP